MRRTICFYDPPPLVFDLSRWVVVDGPHDRNIDVLWFSDCRSMVVLAPLIQQARVAVYCQPESYIDRRDEAGSYIARRLADLVLYADGTVDWRPRSTTDLDLIVRQEIFEDLAPFLEILGYTHKEGGD